MNRILEAFESIEETSKAKLNKIVGEKNSYNCEHCDKLFKARAADRRRGWAFFCSKSCAAKFKHDRDMKLGIDNREYYGTRN